MMWSNDWKQYITCTQPLIHESWNIIERKNNYFFNLVLSHLIDLAWMLFLCIAFTISASLHGWQSSTFSGVPKLKRSELEAACEDFSNVIGTSSIGTVYKGTLSTGVEIAVASVAVTSSKDWSKTLEAQFRKKVLSP